MAVIRRRSRLVYFRLTEEEYQQMRNLCETEGARSISDLARVALQRMAERRSERDSRAGPVTLQTIGQIVAELNQSLVLVSNLLDTRTSTEPAVSERFDVNAKGD